MGNAVELVFIPTPGMGHIVSAVQIAKIILERDQRISISIHIINLPSFSDKTNAYVDSQLRDNPYPTRLIFVTFPPLSNPPDPSLPFSFQTVIELHKLLVKQAVEDRVRVGSPKPAGFVLDMFCTAMVDIANELNVPSYCFFTSGASFLNLVFYSLSLADDHGIDIAIEFSKPDFSALVPGFKNPVTSSIIPAVMQEENGSKILLNLAKKFTEMKGILVNTYEELESFAIQTLSDNNVNKIPPIYPIGPLLELGDKNRGGSEDNAEKSSIIQWLDGQPKSSVVFLCFGSMGSFDEEQVKEIAEGLEKSGHRFLWALRKPPPEGKGGAPSETFLEALPEGFLHRTSNRGKVIGWAPQVDVLAHPAVGGFVSHCGWNSTLESLWFGVPMAAWPLYAEQQMNAFTLVKEFELAVEIRIDYKRDWKDVKGNFLITAEEVENGVKKLMNMDEKMKEKVELMSKKGRNALKEGGSSYNWLGRFIEDVFSNVV